MHAQKHPDLGDHTQRPELADNRGRITVIPEVQAEEGIVWPVACLDQETNRQHGEHYRLFQYLP